MKGMVFTEFLEMVEEKFSPEMADKIIEASELESEGAYTSVGTYDHREMVALIAQLGNETDTPVPILMHTFGQHLFKRFKVAYPNFFSDSDNTFSLLSKVDGTIHTEVRKLYPDAELPKFTCEYPDANSMIMHYRSERCFADLAEGLISGCIENYDENMELSREDMPCDAGSHVKFTLKKIA